MAKNTDEKKMKAAAKKAALVEKQKAKKAAAKAKKAAKKAAALEKKRAMALKKKERKAALKAKKLARLEKIKAKKAALKEKKRLAKEKQKAIQVAKTAKIKKDKVQEPTGGVDIREASKAMKAALAQVANDMALLDLEKRIKKAKSIRGLGYDVETTDEGVVVRFDVEKLKKIKAPKVKETVVEEPKAVAAEETVIEPKVEQVVEIPAGDLLGADGQVDAEVATIDPDDEIAATEDEDDIFGNSDGSIPDSRDEQDEDLIAAREEYFSNAADFDEDIDN